VKVVNFGCGCDHGCGFHQNAPSASLYFRNSNQENKLKPLTTKTVQQWLFVNAPSVINLMMCVDDVLAKLTLTYCSYGGLDVK
jgi:hypothetical protein